MEMKGRIFAMALLHETLYRSGKFAQVNLASYLRQVAMQLFRIQNPAPGIVGIELDLEPNEVEIEQAIPCGLIVNELLTNSLKYAFPDGRPGVVRLTLQGADDKRIRLQVADNGVGLPANFDLAVNSSLGLHLVTDLVQQLQGQWTIDRGPGTCFTVVFAGKSGHSAHPLPDVPGSTPAS
ncbi:MAG: sensor histidine kinase [Opitutales bacterium]